MRSGMYNFSNHFNYTPHIQVIVCVTRQPYLRTSWAFATPTVLIKYFSFFFSALHFGRQTTTVFAASLLGHADSSPLTFFSSPPLGDTVFSGVRNTSIVHVGCPEASTVTQTGVLKKKLSFQTLQ